MAVGASIAGVIAHCLLREMAVPTLWQIDRRRATRSDHGDAYPAAFPPSTHRCCGKEEGETCHVERWFGTLRARISRLVRRAYSFSKNAENRLDAIHLFITTYNLILPQKATVG